uniref:Dedicator of cytokinesis C/D N-terminal domain-containing protein n=1 Tax=Periophthalmus magnuspinnatus TaxID=409849 RepID=A0A3B4A3N3_9GOBI
MAAESTRRFTKNLLKPGSAAEMRQTACNAVRLSAVTVSTPQEKPKLIDPLDYEAVISELGDELKEDPLRDLLLFPDNDFKICLEDISEDSCNNTNSLQKDLCDELSACMFYNSDLNVVQFMHEDYAGDYRLLPRYCTPRCNDSVLFKR